MSQALDLLDDALAMARKEKTALEEGSYEKAIELAEERTKITGLAWNALKSADAPAYRARLGELLCLQEQLAHFATAAKTRIRNSLNRSRQEKKRIRGYQLAVEQAIQ